MKFQELEIPTLMMKGMSTPELRIAAWGVSVAITIGMLLAFWYAPVVFELGTADSIQKVGSIILDSFGAVMVIHIAHKLLFPEKLPLIISFRRFTPVGYVMEKDRAAYYKAYDEVMEAASSIDFREALKLAKYDPAIGTFANLRVIANQRQGRLAQWLNTEDRLRQACWLLYLCKRAEQKKEQIDRTGQTDIF